MGVFKDLQNDLECASVKMMTEYRNRLLVDALKLCGNAADAEDLVGSVFKEVFSHSGLYDPEKGELYPYLSGILSHLYARTRRRAVNRGTVAVDPSELATNEALSTNCTDDELFAHSEHDALREAIARLPSDYRDAILLHYFSELPIAKVARILGISDGTVKWRLSMGRKALSEDLGKALGKAKKPLAVLGVLLLGVTTLFGAYQTGLVDALRSLVSTTVPAASSLRGAVTADQLASATRRDAAGTVRGVVTADPLDSATRRDAAGTVRGQTVVTSSNQQQEKQTMKLTQTIAAAALAMTTAVVTSEADGITLQVDQIKQRYPWNGLVDIDYTIVNDNGATVGIDDNLEVTMIDNAVTPAVTNRAITFLQAPLPLTAGKHRITWDANADGVTNRTDNANFIMTIAHYSAAYMVIDVSGGPTAETYPVDFLNGAPPNGFNVNEYKGDKIVLRRIHPGSYMAGSPDNEANRMAACEKQHRVAFSKPFYIGLFEVTQKQYLNVMGGTNPSDAQGDFRPVEKVSYNMIRGAADTSSHRYDWPWTGEVDANSFMGKLRAKCKSKDESGAYTVLVAGFDLPTEFQWEYACRAGTTGALNTTNVYDSASSSDQEAQLLQLGRYANNQTDYRGGISSKHTIVGAYEPNGWGLYDMHGNVWEWCRDWYLEDATGLSQYVDPVGASAGKTRTLRGGSWFNNSPVYLRSAFRINADGPWDTFGYIGFRLVRTLP